MLKKTHILPAVTPGATRELVSLHFGIPGSGPKAYIQASLHSDELPGMLVAHYLRERLEDLEQQGRIRGEIVLVPAANPIGLAQSISGTPFGRFDLATGINFNRAFLNVVPRLKDVLEDKLGDDAKENVRIIRTEARAAVEEWAPTTETGVLKKTLLGLAIDADVMLDLHCDNEAVMHIYTGTPLADEIAPLSGLLAAHAVLLACESGDDPFDEACGRVWWELAAHFGDRFPVPYACLSATVELRSLLDVRHEYAALDAQSLIQFLALRGLINVPVENVPAPQCEATPLEGVEPVVAPEGGLMVFLKELGQIVEAGEALADLIDPLTGKKTVLRPTVSGVFFARTDRRYVHRGTRVAKIAGHKAFRTGNLLSL